MKKLTAKQKAFAQEYIVDLNATQAAIRAGYSKKTANVIASQTLSKLNVQAYVQKLISKRAEKTGINQEWVLKKLTELVDMCMSAKPVLDRQGNETGEYKVDSFGANKALELIAKHLGMFVGKGENPDTTNIYNLVGGDNGDSADKLRADIKRDIKLLFPETKIANRL